MSHLSKVTHQHSTIPDNNYSRKHILFSHNFQRLQRPHENGVCFHAALEVIQEDCALVQPPEPLKIVQEWGMLLCSFWRLQNCRRAFSKAASKTKVLCKTVQPRVGHRDPSTDREHHMKLSNGWQILGLLGNCAIS